MKLSSLLACIFLLVSTGPAVAQTSPTRDPQTVLLFQKSVAAMGGAAPSDSTATGTITLVAGSLKDSGTITILTRGLNETAEKLQMSQEGYRAVIYSSWQANRVTGTTSTPLHLELAATSQCPDFPLPLLVEALNDSDFSLQYIGSETIDRQSAYHIRFWDTFASNKQLQGLAEFTRRDIWLSAASALPLRLSYQRRKAAGSTPRIPMQVDYGNYGNVGGVLYPFLIKKSKDGTPWIAITIQRVQLDTGLTDADFPVSWAY